MKMREPIAIATYFICTIYSWKHIFVTEWSDDKGDHAKKKNHLRHYWGFRKRYSVLKAWQERLSHYNMLIIHQN